MLEPKKFWQWASTYMYRPTPRVVRNSPSWMQMYVSTPFFCPYRVGCKSNHAF